MTAGWVEVGDRVLVRRHRELDLNCGLVVGAGGCLVIDTRSHLAEGRALAEAVRAVTPHPWTVVNTHAHHDHCFGNAAFHPAAIWAHRDCAAELDATAEQQRAAVVADLLAAGDPDAELVATTPIELPDHLVGDRVVLDVGGRAVSLRHLGRGHTRADLVVGVDDVLFAGDLVEEGAPPAMEDAYPLEWPDTVTALLELVRGPVVPGHGAVVDAAFVAAQRDELAELARALVDGADLTSGPFDPDTRRAAAARLHPR